ncbi:DUF2758 domain-containing protein [Streptococcus uberis]|uniref:DUF2758 domain-containing protein n=1 Tax=Streptococcus uberis TaxID=1349 RepID=UPI0021F127A1|nr:DUF2758 domain-containing protein [Streptococcus uberis]MCV6815755.1 DUF2758 domain-containing protein [Streptococcus uberis]MCZ8475769.1 DUF2758 domain-containing protein [Streptococcus uberis]
MKIELLYQSVVVTETSHRPERIDEFQARVNDFIADKKVIDIKYQEAMTGDYENLTTLLSLMVMYNETN